MTRHAGERPLVAFTSLAIAGAGLVAAASYFDLVHGLASSSILAAGTILLAAGLATSLGHLGRKRRAGLVVRGAGRSPLSNEALLAALALATAAVAAGLGLRGMPVSAVTAAAGVTNAAFLVSIGLVYHLRGQRTWQGFSAATPLTGGLAFGAVAVQSLAEPGGMLTATLLFIAIDALLFSQRWRGVAELALSDAAAADPWFLRRSQLMAARLFLLDVVPLFVLAVSPTMLAPVAAAAGLLVDRIGFYALADQHTTESEIADIESRIAFMGRAEQD